MMRFDRFTERAQEAAQRAAEIIQRYGHNQIDTEHILLALIEQPEGAISQILQNLNIQGVDLSDRLDYVLKNTQKASIFGNRGAGQVFITPRVKRIVDVANQEANRLKDEFISTEHLFLAILDEKNTPAARLLETEGLTKDRGRTAGDRSQSRKPLQGPGKVLPRFDKISPGREIGSRDWQRFGDPAGDPDPFTQNQK